MLLPRKRRTRVRLCVLSGRTKPVQVGSYLTTEIRLFQPLFNVSWLSSDKSCFLDLTKSPCVLYWSFTHTEVNNLFITISLQSFFIIKLSIGIYHGCDRLLFQELMSVWIHLYQEQHILFTHTSVSGSQC